MIKSSIKRSLLVVFIALMTVCVSLTSLSARNAKADTLPAFTMGEGAYVRNVGMDATQNGIRFIAEMDTNAYAELEKSYFEVKYGIAVIPKDYAETAGFAITKANLFGDSAVYVTDMSANDAIKSGKRVMFIGESNSLYEYEGKSIISVAMTNIITSNLTREFIGTPYIAYKATETDAYTYELGSYYGNDIANNTRSMTYLAQKAIETGKDVNGNLYTTYVQPAETISAKYEVNYYFANGKGDYVKENALSKTLIANINSVVDVQSINLPWTIKEEAFTLNESLSNLNAKVYANGKTVVNLYYDLELKGGNVFFGYPDELHEGRPISYLTDGTTSNFIWTRDLPKTTSFIAADFGNVDTATGIKITHDANHDVWKGANVEYSVDGKNFIVCGTVTEDDASNGFTEIIFDEPTKVRFVRLTNGNQNLDTWILVAEIERIGSIVKTISYSEDRMSIYQGELSNVIDGNDETYFWVYPKDVESGNKYEGCYFTLNLGKVTEIYDIHFLMANATSPDDYFHNTTLQYQDVETQEWIDIATYNGVSSIRHSISPDNGTISTQYIRAIAGAQAANYIVIREFDVNRNVVGVMKGDALTPYWDCDKDGYISAIDGDLNTFVAFVHNDDLDTNYVTFDLRSVQEVKSVYIHSGSLKDDGSWADLIPNGNISYSVDNEIYTTISDIDMPNGIYEVMLAVPVSARYIKFEFNGLGHWARIAEFAVNYDFDVITGNAFSNLNDKPYSGECPDNSNQISNLTDGDESTFVWLTRNGEVREDRTLTLNLRGETSVSNVYLTSAKNANGDYYDKFNFGLLEYSIDGVTFFAVSDSDITTEQVGDTLVITLNSSINAKFVRVTDYGGGWLAISEFGINA